MELIKLKSSCNPHPASSVTAGERGFVGLWHMCTQVCMCNNVQIKVRVEQRGCKWYLDPLGGHFTTVVFHLILITILIRWSFVHERIIRMQKKSNFYTYRYKVWNAELGVCRRNLRRGKGRKRCNLHWTHGLKMMVVGSTNDVRTGGLHTRMHTHTHSFTHTLSHSHTRSFSGAGSPWDGGAGHLGYKAAIETRPRC